MPQAEDTWETQIVITWIERMLGLQEALAWMNAKELQRYFDPLKERNGPEHLYLDFQRNQRDWDQVDWEAIEEKIADLSSSS